MSTQSSLRIRSTSRGSFVLKASYQMVTSFLLSSMLLLPEHAESRRQSDAVTQVLIVAFDASTGHRNGSNAIVSVYPRASALMPMLRAHSPWLVQTAQRHAPRPR